MTEKSRTRTLFLARWPVIDGVALGPANRVKNASRLAAALPSSPCLRSLQPILAEHDPEHIIEPAATTTEQITGNSSRTARTAARPLWFRAKRQLATPIRKLRLAQVANF